MSIFQNMGQRAAGGVRDWFSPGEMTYEEMLRRRQIAQTAQTRQRDLSAPGAGFGALADAFVGKIAGGQADAATTKGREGASSALGALLQGRVGGGGMSAPQMNLLPPQQATSGGQMQPQISPDGSIQRPQGMAASVIAGFEGFRETPYWDVNALRTGFGSDTVTMPDGSVQKVGKGTRVSREDAQRDLERRIGTEFMPRAASAVGQERFAQLSPEQQAALTSITYNYGSLPKSVAAAVKTPDPYDDIAAIRALGSHNDGVNAGRRSKEAELYAGSGSPGAMSFAAGGEPNVQFTSQMGGGEGIDPRLAELMQNPYVAELPQAQQGALAALFQQQLGQAYPEQMTPYQQAQVGLQRDQFDWQREQAMQPQPGYQVVTGEQAAQMGLDPSQAYNLGPDGKVTQVGGGGTNVTVNSGSEVGTIPQGFELYTDPETGGRSMRPIPGGPADTTKTDAAAQQNRETSTDIITSAASRAREAAGNRAMGEYGQGIGQMLPWTDAAEVRRQVEVLQANAKIENLTAMRAASPTGGALGAVSDSENAMLAAKAGALDPSSPNFLRDLEDYERTLLRTVHGAEAGDRIYEQTRTPTGAADTPQAITAPPPPPESVMPPPPGVDAIENMSDDDLIRRYLGG